jgi:superfamily II DNA helicase RecQ
MAFKFFTVPIHTCEAAEAELNSFLQSHKVLDVERRWVDQGPNSFRSFCVDYLDPVATGGRGSRQSRYRSKVDYREVLSNEDFAVFSKLRDLRKEVAQETGVPVYAIFNNEQLAQIVQRKASTKADLEAITHVGDARIEKYGSRFLDFLTQQWDTTNETDGESV